MWHFASYLISGCVLGKVLCDLCSNQNNYGHKLHMQNWAEVGVLTHLPVPLGNCWFLTKGLSQTPACSGCLLSLCFSTFLSSSREIERKKKIRNLTIAEEEGEAGVRRVASEPPAGACYCSHHPFVQVRSSLWLFRSLIRLKVPWGWDQVSCLFCTSCSTFSNVEDVAGARLGSGELNWRAG